MLLCLFFCRKQKIWVWGSPRTGVLTQSGEGTPQQVLTAAKIRLSRILGYGSILALSKKPLPPLNFFRVLLFRRDSIFAKLITRFNFCKIDKNEGRHQAKDHAQFSLLRDSFLDLIPALCFHIHPAYPQDSDERLKAESQFPQRSLSRWGLYHARRKKR